MKTKIITIIILLASILFADECSYENMINLSKINSHNLKSVDKSFLLKTSNNEELKFLYSKNNNLKLVKYQGFAYTYKLEINYYVGKNNNLLVEVIRVNYTDFVGSKVMDDFSKTITQFPLCGSKNFNDLNYDELEVEYKLASKIRKIGKF